MPPLPLVRCQAADTRRSQPARPVQVVKTRPVLVQPGTQRRVGARIILTRKRRHAQILRQRDGDPTSQETHRIANIPLTIGPWFSDKGARMFSRTKSAAHRSGPSQGAWK